MKQSLTGILLVLSLCGSALAALASSPAKAYCDFALSRCTQVEKNLAAITLAAEVVARRHLNGGVIGFSPINYQSLEEELTGRAGGMINLGFDRVWTQERTAEQKKNDVALISWEHDPLPTDLEKMKALREQGVFIIGFGPAGMPSLAEHMKLCDVVFDTHTAGDDRVVTLPDGTKAGRCNHLINTLNGWTFIAEVVAALTRQGKMPPMYISYAKEEGKAWGEKYFLKKQFHDDLAVAPIPAGALGKAYLTQIRSYIKTFRLTQLKGVREAAGLIYGQAKEGSKVLVLTIGHMPYTYVGRYEDARWAKLVDFEIPSQKEALEAEKPMGKLVLRVGYFGESPEMKGIMTANLLRSIYISAGNPREGWQIPENRLLDIDMGIPFGDACVKIKDYPIKVFAPSGVMQIVAYEAVNAEVLARLAKK